MRHINQWTIVILVIVGLQLSACGQGQIPVTGEKPAQVEAIEGTNLKRVILTEKAAERLDIQTALLREEQVRRTRMVGGMVVASPDGSAPGPGKVWVQVFLTENDLNLVDQSQPALIRPLDDDEEDDDTGEGLTGEADEGPQVDDAEDDDSAEAVLYYVVDDADNRLAPGQRVFVEISLSTSGTRRIVIPYSAVIYDTHGETWVYTNPEPLVFVRHPIVIDYIEGDLAFLSVGPPSGMAVVTVGGAELYGAETGVSK
jgi:hypothetical protein